MKKATNYFLESNYFLALGILLAGLVGVTSCKDDDSPSPGEGLETVTALIVSDDDLSVLESILTNNDYDLSGVLQTASDADATLTVFAPTNQAFTDLLTALDLSLADLTPAVVNEIVQYHILTQKLMSDDLEAQEYATLLGSNEEVVVTLSDDVEINNATVVAANMEASNGVIHKIDRVLIPSEPSAILGTVLQPAYFNREFTTLVAAVKKAELVATLTDADSDYTVFAPSNAAFTNAGITSLDDLTKDALNPILLYHTIGSKIMSTDLPATNGSSAVVASLGGNFFLSNNANGVFINGAIEVTSTDLEVGSSVVHVIDHVMLPASGDLVSVASDNADFDVLVAALTRTATEGTANLVSVLQGDGPFTVFAPTDAAFIGFTGAADETEAIAAVNGLPIATLVQVLQYHVVAAAVASADVAAGAVTTASTDQFTIAIDGTSITIEDINTSNMDAVIQATDVLATNGLIHVIDQVLSPIN